MHFSELRLSLSVEVLVHGVTLDLTCKFLRRYALARLRVPLWDRADHHHGNRFCWDGSPYHNEQMERSQRPADS
jgi:hypothetical protein